MTKFDIQIIGARNQHNGLLARFLKQEMGEDLVCTILRGWDQASISKNQPAPLVLLDYQGTGLEPFIEQLKSESSASKPAFFAIFNVTPNYNPKVVNKEMLSYGLRGVFNAGEPLEDMLQGIRALLNNELWIPQDILAPLLKEKRGPDHSFNPTSKQF